MKNDNEQEPAAPRHVGYIVDGNRRWAKKHGLPTYEGHLAGYNTLRDIIFETFDQGIEYVSIYAFSTENWKRSQGEVGKLMRLALRIFKTDVDDFVKRDIRIRVFGVEDDLDEAVIKAMRASEERTKGGSKTLCICFNYGGRREIVDATKRAVRDGIDLEAINEETLAQYMYEPDVPDLDVIVRTSGEHRLSNFMLWRAAYSEFIFLDTLFPDMREADVYEIIEEYKRRGRRFGR